MSKKSNNVFLIILFLEILCSCTNNTDDSYYFNGNIVHIDRFQREIDLTSSKVYLEDIYDDRMIVCDSLLLFKSYKYADNWFYVFDIKNGKHILSICPKGEGPNDFLYCIESEQIISENGDTKIWVNDFVSNSRLINITQSLSCGKTVCDSVIPMPWHKYFEYPATALFFLKDKYILAKNQCEQIYEDHEYMPRSYRLYKESLENEIANYIIYKNPISNIENPNFPYMLYYASRDRIKPDETKVVMAMQMIGQINILDIKSGNIQGFRINGSLSFTDLGKHIDRYRNYYLNICVNNDFIFAPYIDALSEQKGFDPFLSSCIHVFDWNGNAVYKMNLKEKIFSISLDQKNSILYAIDMNDNIYSYDISFLKNISE